MDAFIQDSVKPVQKIFSDYIDPSLENPLMSLVISFITVVSVIYALEGVPENVKNIFKHPSFILISSFIIVYNKTRQLDVSLLSAIGFVVILKGVNFVSENFELIFPETDAYPGCVDVKVKDLLDLFEGDREKLKKSMYVSGVPLDVELTDANAPLIATYLINYGKDVSSTCKAPN